MIQRLTVVPPDLYEADETAWLDLMAELIAAGRLDELDYRHLRECLIDMATRERREVKSRLRVLLAHLLKWAHQPDQRTNSWRATIMHQQAELADHASTGVLRNHAEAIVGQVYTDAVKHAAAETGLPKSTFPAECLYTIDQLFNQDLLAD